MIYSLPNLLTLGRIGVIPLITLFLFLPGQFSAWVALILFTLACITDFLDGFLARSMRQTSPFGKFLDPIADKLLVATVIFILTAEDKIANISILPALVILLREFIVSGLREFLAELKQGLPVSPLAKWKTAIQMLALGFLIMGDYHPWGIPCHFIGIIGIWAAAILTLMTGWDYLKESLKYMFPEDSME